MRDRLRRRPAVAFVVVFASLCGCRDATISTPELRVVALGGFEDESALVRSDDGGLTWEALSPPPSPLARDLDFASHRDGLLIGAGQTIFATSDGGMTWRDVFELRTDDERDFISGDALAYAGTPARAAVAGFTRGPGGPGQVSTPFVLLTADGGEQWGFVDSDALAPDLSDLALCFTGGGRGLAAGIARFDDFGSGVRALVSPDGGVTWAVAAGASATFGQEAFALVLDVACADEAGLWVLGEAGGATAPIRFALARSLDGGATWADLSAALPSEDGLLLGSLSFVDERRGVLVGTHLGDPGTPRPAVFRSDDGGASWETVETPAVQAILAEVRGAIAPADGEPLWLVVGTKRADQFPSIDIGLVLRIRREGGAEESRRLPIGVTALREVALALDAAPSR